MYIGDRPVSKIYLGEEVIWSNAPMVLWDSSNLNKIAAGQDSNEYSYDGIMWRKNPLPRPDYTGGSIAVASWEYVNTNGSMYLHLGDNTSSSLSYNAHFSTVDTISIPFDAENINFEVSRGPTAVSLTFGLIQNGTNDSFTAGTGRLETRTVPYGSTHTVFSVSIPDNSAGSSGIYRPVVNIRGPRSTNYGYAYVWKVWFS